MDPYAVLGVARTASSAEITSAYRRLVRKHHPDARGAAHNGEDQALRQVLDAYAILRDPDRRADYDRRHTPRYQASPRMRRSSWPTTGISSGRRRIPINHRGSDTAAAVSITAEQARTGVVVTVAAPTEPRGLRPVRVRIPSNVADGQTLRVTNAGAPGGGDGSPGDLYLTIHVERATERTGR